MMRIKSIHQSLKFCFSTQGKHTPKPVKIEFDFKIPNNSTAQQAIPSSESQVKIIKGKRSDISKLFKKKKQDNEYKSRIQQEHLKNYQSKVEQNLKTQNYHKEQYFKGQHLVQNIPLDPYHSYKLQEFQRKLQLKKQQFKTFVGKAVDYQLKSKLRQRMVDLYHEKQHKYQNQQYFKYLEEYPGSPKGPKPQDDPEFYLTYALKKIPQVLQNELGLAKNSLKKQQKSANSLADLESHKLCSQKNYAYMMGSNRSLTAPQAKEEYDQNYYDVMKSSDPSIFKQYQDVPQFPQMEMNSYQQYMKDMTNWRNFKNYYVKKNGVDLMKKDIQYINRVYNENDPDPQNQYFIPRAASPSLLRYYKTLPKVIQDNPGIKDIYLGLEYHLPWYTYEQKEQALNKAAALVQPLDKVSLRAMTDFVTQSKNYMTPFIADKLMTINPEFTWDINQFFAQIKRQQLKGQSMIKQNQGSFPTPPQKHMEWQGEVSCIPVDFYDNDDGFWDEIITEKLKRQDSVKPIMKVRKHFTH